MYFVFSDGGARGNPGPGGAGAVLIKDGEVIAEKYKYLGVVTNNVAEYEAVLLSCELLETHVDKNEEVAIRLDSELAVKQIQGEYKVKQPHLKPYVEVVRAKLSQYPNSTIAHVLRHENKKADELANKAMDEGMGITS